jgi:hypothetical protein
MEGNALRITRDGRMQLKAPNRQMRGEEGSVITNAGVADHDEAVCSVGDEQRNGCDSLSF